MMRSFAIRPSGGQHSPHDPLGGLSAAVGGDALSVALQPIVDVGDGSIWAYEALGRAASGRGPAELLSEADACGYLLELDRRWRLLAIESMRALPSPVRCSLNVDPRVADDPRFAPGFTRTAIADAGLDPSRFVLELTEAEGSRVDLVERVVAHYADQGFLLALDDVGARGQSLDRVLRLRPAILKLDGSLVQGIHLDGAKRRVVRALVDLAEGVGARVVAEGVETSEELASVVRQGVHFVQGFYLARPAVAPAVLDERVASELHGIRVGPARGARVDEVEPALLALIDALPRKRLDEALQLVTVAATRLLGATRASLRLLDDDRTSLLVAARTGASLHRDAATTFAVGEGLIGWVVTENRPLRVGNASNDPRFSWKPGLRASVGSFLGVPIPDEHGACVGVLAVTSEELDAFGAQEESRLRLLAGVVAPTLQVGRLRRLAQTDPLTRVLNRHALEDVLPAVGDDHAPQAVMIVDIDHFKRINDVHGHAAGDAALRAIALEIASSVRTDDRVLRLGGEEFLVVLPGSSASVATPTAERIRARVATAALIAGETVTVSIGVAAREPGEPRDQLLARADAALYRAKHEGRDRVVVASDHAR